ncbi:MAG TPA: CBS domain-containing protein [Planctomycetota bacterium]|nr:CBS domain-containing protein [Planctomycetota bacterium]
MSFKIGDLMTRPVEVVPPNMSVRKVAALMKERNIGVYPVCEEKSLLGIVTDRDLALRVLAEGRNPETTRVEEIMSTDVVSCGPEDRIDEVLKMMANRQVRRIPVLSRHGELVGLVTLGKVAETDCEASGEVLKEVIQPGTGERP